MKFSVVGSFKKDGTRYSNGDIVELSLKEYREVREFVRPLQMSKEPYSDRRRSLRYGESILKLKRTVLKRIKRESLARAMESQLDMSMSQIRKIPHSRLVDIIVKYRGF